MGRTPEVSLDALFTWALGALRPRTAGKRARKPPARSARKPVKDPFPRAIEIVAARFGLDPLERRLLALLYAAERSLAVSKAARTLRGAHAHGLTVEVARQALGESAIDLAIDRALAPGRRLRAHALVALETEGPSRSNDELALGCGLAARLDGDLHAGGLGAGVWRLSAESLPDWARALAPSAPAVAIVKQELLPSREPLWLAIDGCKKREGFGLALALVRAGRAVILVDVELALARGISWGELAACRREADLDGGALVVTGAAALGERWRALAAPPACGAERPMWIVLADTGKLSEPLALEGFTARALPLPALAQPSESRPARDDGFDQIRQLAVRDAERALGIIRMPPAPATPANATAAPASATAPPASATAPPAPATVTSVAATAASASATPPATAPAQTATPATTASATEAAKPFKRSKKGMMYFGDPDAERASAVSRETRAAPPPAIAPATLAPAPAPATIDVGEPPFVEVPADAKPEALARICALSPNPRQRIQLISELSGLRSSAVVAAIRSNAKSEHPGVRAAAEAAMAKMFGPSWNVTRPVSKPIQPPRSDDES